MFSVVKGNGLGAYHLFDGVHIVPCDVDGALCHSAYMRGYWTLDHALGRAGRPTVVLVIDARPGSIHVEVGLPELAVRVTSESVADFPVTVCEAAAIAASVYEAVEEGTFEPAKYESITPPSARNPKHSVLIDGFAVEVFQQA